jgi:tripartite-type tricarboxylate transporter receptor subunit TctC
MPRQPLDATRPGLRLSRGAHRTAGHWDYEPGAVFLDIRTMGQSGLKRVEADNWYGNAATPNLPKAINYKLHTTSVAALKSAEVTRRLAGQGVAFVVSTQAVFTSYTANEINQWGDVAMAAGIKLQ